MLQRWLTSWRLISLCWLLVQRTAWLTHRHVLTLIHLYHTTTRSTSCISYFISLLRISTYNCFLQWLLHKPQMIVYYSYCYRTSTNQWSLRMRWKLHVSGTASLCTTVFVRPRPFAFAWLMQITWMEWWLYHRLSRTLLKYVWQCPSLVSCLPL